MASTGGHRALGDLGQTETGKYPSRLRRYSLPAAQGAAFDPPVNYGAAGISGGVVRVELLMDVDDQEFDRIMTILTGA
ncbi:MAG: hypothetical protein HYV26_13680 [Candidatus Hydrogenedentes bacterium]|nr:hypothetical protein [Candidatus Hydrogenedentota bacterium]